MTSPNEGWREDVEYKVRYQLNFLTQDGYNAGYAELVKKDLIDSICLIVSRSEEAARKEERERCIDIHHEFMDDHGHKRCNCFRASVYENLSAPADGRE